MYVLLEEFSSSLSFKKSLIFCCIIIAYVATIIINTIIILESMFISFVLSYISFIL